MSILLFLLCLFFSFAQFFLCKFSTLAFGLRSAGSHENIPSSITLQFSFSDPVCCGSESTCKLKDDLMFNSHHNAYIMMWYTHTHIHTYRVPDLNVYTRDAHEREHFANIHVRFVSELLSIRTKIFSKHEPNTNTSVTVSNVFCWF